MRPVAGAVSANGVIGACVAGADVLGIAPVEGLGVSVWVDNAGGAIAILGAGGCKV